MSAIRRREVLVEAGHRCAIPTCKQVPVEVHHIDGKRANHAFENLIALCPTCHTRADRGEIDRPSLRIYKANLGLISSRYGDLERRVLDMFVDDPTANLAHLPTELSVLMNYLVRDGIVERRLPANEVGVERFPSYRHYWLTETGRAFVERLAKGRPVE
jgi:hypothetical protein